MMHCYVDLEDFIRNGTGKNQAEVTEVEKRVYWAIRKAEVGQHSRLGKINIDEGGRKGAGRPSKKNDPETIRRIMAAFEAGYKIPAVAGVAGISGQTLRNWLQADKKFLERCEVARSRARARLERILLTNAQKDPEYALKVASRYYKDLGDRVAIGSDEEIQKEGFSAVLAAVSQLYPNRIKQEAYRKDKKSKGEK